MIDDAHGIFSVLTRDGSKVNVEAEFEGSEFIIGRDDDCDLRIRRPDVSAKHIRIFLDENGKVMLQNLSNTNPVTLNQKDITTDEPVELNENARICVCERVIMWKPRKVSSVKPRKTPLKSKQVFSQDDSETLRERDQNVDEQNLEGSARTRMVPSPVLRKVQARRRSNVNYSKASTTMLTPMKAAFTQSRDTPMPTKSLRTMDTPSIVNIMETPARVESAELIERSTETLVPLTPAKCNNEEIENKLLATPKVAKPPRATPVKPSIPSTPKQAITPAKPVQTPAKLPVKQAIPVPKMGMDTSDSKPQDQMEPVMSSAVDRQADTQTEPTVSEPLAQTKTVVRTPSKLDRAFTAPRTSTSTHKFATPAKPTNKVDPATRIRGPDTPRPPLSKPIRLGATQRPILSKPTNSIPSKQVKTPVRTPVVAKQPTPVRDMKKVSTPSATTNNVFVTPKPKTPQTKTPLRTPIQPSLAEASPIARQITFDDEEELVSPQPQKEIIQNAEENGINEASVYQKINEEAQPVQPSEETIAVDTAQEIQEPFNELTQSDSVVAPSDMSREEPQPTEDKILEVEMKLTSPEQVIPDKHSEMPQVDNPVTSLEDTPPVLIGRTQDIEACQTAEDQPLVTQDYIQERVTEDEENARREDEEQQGEILTKEEEPQTKEEENINAESETLPEENNEPSPITAQKSEDEQIQLEQIHEETHGSTTEDNIVNEASMLDIWNRIREETDEAGERLSKKLLRLPSSKTKANKEYFTVISNPIDLTQIRKHIVSGDYTVSQFIEDMTLLFDNAISWSKHSNNTELLNNSSKLKSIFAIKINEATGVQIEIPQPTVGEVLSPQETQTTECEPESASSEVTETVEEEEEVQESAKPKRGARKSTKRKGQRSEVVEEPETTQNFGEPVEACLTPEENIERNVEEPQQEQQSTKGRGRKTARRTTKKEEIPLENEPQKQKKGKGRVLPKSEEVADEADPDSTPELQELQEKEQEQPKSAKVRKGTRSRAIKDKKQEIVEEPQPNQIEEDEEVSFKSKKGRGKRTTKGKKLSKDTEEEQTSEQEEPARIPDVTIEQIEAMKVVELRAELKKLGLSYSGLKNELIKRLATALGVK